MTKEQRESTDKDKHVSSICNYCAESYYCTAFSQDKESCNTSTQQLESDYNSYLDYQKNYVLSKYNLIEKNKLIPILGDLQLWLNDEINTDPIKFILNIYERLENVYKGDKID